MDGREREKMHFSELKKGMYVEDLWYWDWGEGRVVKLLKTVVHVYFSIKGLVVYDKPHTIFLKERID